MVVIGLAIAFSARQVNHCCTLNARRSELCYRNAFVLDFVQLEPHLGNSCGPPIYGFCTNDAVLSELRQQTTGELITPRMTDKSADCGFTTTCRSKLRDRKLTKLHLRPSLPFGLYQHTHCNLGPPACTSR